VTGSGGLQTAGRDGVAPVLRVARTFLPVLGLKDGRIGKGGRIVKIGRIVRIGTDRNVCAALKRLRIGTDKNVCATLAMRGVFV